MNDNSLPLPGPSGPDANWEDLLRSILGPEAAAAIVNEMKQSGVDPTQFSEKLGMPTDGIQMQGVIEQIKRIMNSPADGPMNWQMTGDLAQHTAHGGKDPSITAATAAQIRQALSVADLWLDAVTDLTPIHTTRFAWSRTEWITNTLPAWRQVCEPVAANATRALADALAAQLAQSADFMPPELAQSFSGVIGPEGMVNKLAGTVFGSQMGMALGSLAKEAFGSSDVGFPLTEQPCSALVPSNIDEFMDGLDLPAGDVLQFLAVRECAHSRLFGQVTWLRGHVLTAINRYASEIAIDTEAIEEATRQVDPFNPEQLQQALQGGMIGGTQTPAQAAAVANLETTLAVIEGWVEVVTHQAVLPHLPSANALRELMRRRRAAGGPAEQIFSSLIGLELRPRRCREAAELWTVYGQEVGSAERDHLWSHPDLMPTSAELDEPRAFNTLRAAAAAADFDVDAELEKLLSSSWEASSQPDGDNQEAPSGDTQPDGDNGDSQ